MAGRNEGKVSCANTPSEENRRSELKTITPGLGYIQVSSYESSQLWIGVLGQLMITMQVIMQ